MLILVCAQKNGVKSVVLVQDVIVVTGVFVDELLGVDLWNSVGFARNNLFAKHVPIPMLLHFGVALSVEIYSSKSPCSSTQPPGICCNLRACSCKLTRTTTA